MDSKKAAALHQMQDHIRRVWLRLTEEEIATYATDYTAFCDAVHRQYGLSQQETERQLRLWAAPVRAAA